MGLSPTMICMSAFRLKLTSAALWLSVSAMAQTSAPVGMETYSPYTPEQIQEFNNQAISPVEGPLGPVAPNAGNLNLQKQSSLDSKYYSQPKGEEEAESLEVESAQPYQPMSPVIRF